MEHQTLAFLARLEINLKTVALLSILTTSGADDFTQPLGSLFSSLFVFYLSIIVFHPSKQPKHSLPAVASNENTHPPPLYIINVVVCVFSGVRSVVHWVTSLLCRGKT